MNEFQIISQHCLHEFVIKSLFWETINVMWLKLLECQFTHWGLFLENLAQGVLLQTKIVISRDIYFLSRPCSLKLFFICVLKAFASLHHAMQDFKKYF